MKNKRPLLRMSLIANGRTTTFYGLDKTVTMEIPAALAKKLPILCNGVNTEELIVSSLETNWDRADVEGLLTELFEREILIDSRRLDEEVWRAVENPMLFPAGLLDSEVRELVTASAQRCRSEKPDQFFQPKRDGFASLLSQRRSIRRFSDENAPFQSVVNMLWSAYGEVEQSSGEVRKTSPSAGALYPTLVHVAIMRDTEHLTAGVYRVCYGKNRGVGLIPVSQDTNRFARAFLSPLTISNGAQGVIIISGSFEITAEKYGNRSILFVPLEAGHAAQNIMLQATEDGLATLEVGGFVDELVRKAIDLPDQYVPLTTIVFGIESKTPETTRAEPSPSVDWAIPMAGSYKPPFAIASVRFSEKRSWAHGRDASPKLALLKATSEAREWTSCGCIPSLEKGRKSDTPAAIDPRQVISFHPSQYNVPGFPFAPFDETAEYEWAVGYDIKTGAERKILADLVYFPYFPETPYYAYANSSGCAAHPSEQVALETGVLELIERDSFMGSYLGRLVRPTVHESTLPQSIRDRIRNLNIEGFRIWVKEHSLDLAPVVLVFAQNENLNFTTCASCASFDVTHAVSHALMEVEASVLHRLQIDASEDICPSEVVMPRDHGRLYGQQRFYRRADFLAHDKNTISLKDVGGHVAHSWIELMDRFHKKNLSVIAIPLTLSEEYGGNVGLHIIRSVIPSLIPMTFGYRQEPGGMSRVYSLAREFGGQALSYKRAPKFPHPFE